MAVDSVTEAAVPDLVTVGVPIGGRVLVVSGLQLTNGVPWALMRCANEFRLELVTGNVPAKRELDPVALTAVLPLVVVRVVDL